MSNYTTENLVPVLNPENGIPAIRIGDQVFTMAAGGVDVSDTTATAGNVLNGYYFYNSSGVKTSGSIQTVTASASGNVVTVPAGYIASSQTLTIGTAVASQTITPGTADQTIAADSYLSGAITIKGDANLVAANIASGVTIFGVTGTATGGATDFYKCASVDTVNETWTGYKAVLSNGVYSYESTVTSGLTYGSGFTPEVGKIYDDGALVKVDKLYIGLDPAMVFYAPLAESSAAAETGQVFTQTGTVAYTTENGIPCAYFNGSARLSFEMASLLRTLSISAWFKCSNSSTTPVILGTPGSSHHTASIYIASSNAGWSSWGDDKLYSCTAGVWHHMALCANSSDGSVDVYIDGTLAGTSYHTWELQQTNGWLGGNTQGYGLNGYLAAVRIYDRLLTSSEVAALAAEFTPSAS